MPLNYFYDSNTDIMRIEGTLYTGELLRLFGQPGGLKVG